MIRPIVLSIFFLAACFEAKSDDRSSDEGYQYFEVAEINRWGNEISALSDSKKFIKDSGECQQHVTQLPEDFFLNRLMANRKNTNFNSEERLDRIEIRCRVRQVADRACMTNLLRRKGFDVDNEANRRAIGTEHIFEVMSQCSNPITSVRIIK